MTTKKIAYVDGTDWWHHVEHDIGGTIFYPSTESLLRERMCAKQCGVVRVSITEEEWVIEPAEDLIEEKHETQDGYSFDEQERL